MRRRWPVSDHTPGPWKWTFIQVPDGTGHYKTTAVMLESAHPFPNPCNDPTIFAVREDWIRWMGQDISSGNRALIAAAPDLLAALNGLLDWCGEHTGPTMNNSPHFLCVAAYEAIAKAEGRGS